MSSPPRRFKPDVTPLSDFRGLIKGVAAANVSPSKNQRGVKIRMYLMGFIVWAAIGVVLGFIVHMWYRGPETSRSMTMVFGFFGAFIGGMLSMSGYLYHDPEPLRIGGLIGALSGAAAFTVMYHFVAKKAL